MSRSGLAVVVALVLASSSAFADGYHYQPGLHADPFRVPQVAPEPCLDEAVFCDASPLELKLTALVTGRSKPLAMLEDGHGETRIVRRGSLVGRSRVEDIRSDRVILVETHATPSGPVQVTRELKIN